MRLSIRGKMILSIGIPAAAIFVTAVLWILASAEKQVRQKKEAEMAEQTLTAAARFDEYIGRAARIADTTARFINYVPNLGDQQIYGMLSGTVKLNRRVYGAAMAFEPGVYKEGDELFCPYVHKKKGTKGLEEMNIDRSVYDWYGDEQWQWWHLPKKLGKGVWTDPYFDEGAGNILMVTYAAPFNRKGEFGGVTTVDIDLERLQDDIEETIPGIGDFYVLGADGHIIFSPIPDEILSGTIFELLKKDGRSDQGGAVKAMLGGDAGEITVDAGAFGEQRTLVAFAPILSPGWTFITFQPEAEALAEFHERRAYVIAGFSLAGALMLLSIVFMSGRVARPIQRLRGQVLRIADGESDVALDDIKTGDEIEELAGAFGIMQRKVADREVKLENARETTLTDLLESAPDAMIVADAEGRICRMNGRMAEIFGFEREELEGMSVVDLMPPHFRERHGKYMKAYFANPETRQMGTEIALMGYRKDGTEFPIEIGLSPFREPQGMMAVAAIRDITDRKKQETELRKLNQAIDQSSTMVFITDVDGDIEYVNPRFTEVTGYTPEEAIGQNPSLLKSGHSDPKMYAEVWEALTNGDEWRGEFCNQRKDGTLFWASASLAPIRGADGNTTHFLAIEDDISDEKEAAEEIKRKEERFRTLLANLPGTVYRCAHDANWTMLFVSDRVEELTGYPASEFLGDGSRSFDSVIHPDDREITARDVKKAISERKPWKVHYRVLHKGGIERWAAGMGRAIYREDGEANYLDGVIIDITREKKLEAEALLAREQAEAANHAKSDFLSSMSHELRTPLNGVLGYAQILQRDKTATPKQRENVESIINCGDHLLALINDVLDLSKIEAGRLDLEMGPCDLEKLIQSMTDIVGQRARSKDLDFHVEVSPEVPRGIMTDGPKLRQILVNLLGNAVKFTAEGSVTLRVSEKPGDQLAFEVIDTGVGLEPHELEEIFDPFKQVEAGKAAGGTGLGLAISRKLLEKMGGEFEVESEKGKGSCFRVILPLEEVAEEDLGSLDADELAEYSDAALAPGEKVRILVTDDRVENRDILKQMLEDIGFEIGLADDGDTCLEVMADSTFDLVLLDVRMPRLNGIETVKLIRQDPKLKDIPVIAVTASVFPEFREKAIASGFDDFLPKPFRASELMQKLKQHLDVKWESRISKGGGDSDSAAAEPGSLEISEASLEKFRAALKIKNLTALNALARELEENAETAATGAEIGKRARSFDFAGLAELELELSRDD